MNETGRFTRMVVCTLMLCVAVGVSQAAAGRGPAAGDKAPALTLPTLDGAATAVVGPGQDRMAIILFWATWSPRSATALKYLEQLAAKYPNAPWKYFAVNSDHPKDDPARREEIQRALAGITFPGAQLIDADLSALNAYGIVALPTVIFVDRTGTIGGFVAGFHTAAPEEVEEILGRMAPETVAAVRTPTPILARQSKGGADRYVGMARSLIAMGQEEQAIAGLKDALERDPEYPEAYIVLIPLLRKRGDPAAAEYLGTLTALALSTPEQAVAAAGLALSGGKPGDAGGILEKAMKSFPEDRTLTGWWWAARLTAGWKPSDKDRAEIVAATGAFPPALLARLGDALVASSPAEGVALLRRAVEKALAEKYPSR